MDLSTLTPQQRACVEHVNGPLLVSAGAGSGKTFMLTQRIAYALLNPDISGVTDIDQVLAITFTEAAAAEIKARVRNKLRQECMPEQALKVDACWISTIHGMCSRILHENALELGLDPQFGLIGDIEQARLLSQCMDEVLRTSSGQFDALFDEYGKDKAARMVLDLLAQASNVRGELKSLVVAPCMDPHEIARDMYDAIIAVDATARQDVNTKGKQGTIAPKIRDMAEGEFGWRTFERLDAQDALTYRELFTAITGIPTDLYRGSKEPFATAVALFRQTVIRLRRECEMGLADAARSSLVGMAREVHRLYEQRKAALGVLDQDDLIHKTLDAFENAPEMENRYRDRFRLIMVDEFQDTSELQIALISHLTHGDQRLCTVGDTQQSIYRFRGADVGTYLVHKQHMRQLEGAGGLTCELDRNFRSHGDIIRFVNKLFSQKRVFGSDEFIKLGFDERHAENPRNVFPDVARIEVIAHSSEHGKGVSPADRVPFEAEAIAERFCTLHETGSANCRWADMVILLGRMKNAEMYAQALRRRGAPCTITGGSGFKYTPEALLVASLCSALTNPLNSEAMGNVLASDMFGLGSDELLALATSPKGHRRDFWVGMTACVNGEPDFWGAPFSARAKLAASVLRHAASSLDTGTLSSMLDEIAVESGYLTRLQAQGPQGMAQAANFFKALRMVEDAESSNPSEGPAQVCTRYLQAIDGGVKERPGSLNTDEQDAVRILTIHSSKGLEYPIVALADFNGSAGGPNSNLALECTCGHVYLSLTPGSSKPEIKDPPKLSESMIARLTEANALEEPASLGDEDLTAGSFHEALKARRDTEELAEGRRKFYVGATRPREALIIAVNFTATKGSASRDNCINDLRASLFGEDGAWRSAPEGIDYSGTTPAIVSYTRLALDEDGQVIAVREETSEGADEEQQKPEEPNAALGSDKSHIPPLSVPEMPRKSEFVCDLTPTRLPYNPARAATFSYSSIAAHDAEAEQEDKAEAQPVETDEEPTVVPAR
ncbi:MAG: UvrD-helicase domain-containing protein, partial [Coriobacteriaceae bacterium]|nr:UvrD-helicase domain-containing protein [Coriobacteriaceae bacterium]